MELYKDRTKSTEARVEDLLSRMTLEEKAAQLCGDLAASFIVDGKVNIDALIPLWTRPFYSVFPGRPGRPKADCGNIQPCAGLFCKRNPPGDSRSTADGKSVRLSGGKRHFISSNDQSRLYLGTGACGRNERHHRPGKPGGRHHFRHESGD